MSHDEQQALLKIKIALEALRIAEFDCEKVGFGSQVLGPLDDAKKQIEYAIEVIEN